MRKDVGGARIDDVLAYTASAARAERGIRFCEPVTRAGRLLGACSTEAAAAMVPGGRLHARRAEAWDPYERDEVVFFFNGEVDEQRALDAGIARLGGPASDAVVRWTPDPPVAAHTYRSAQMSRFGLQSGGRNLAVVVKAGTPVTGTIELVGRAQAHDR